MEIGIKRDVSTTNRHGCICRLLATHVDNDMLVTGLNRDQSRGGKSAPRRGVPLPSHRETLFWTLYSSVQLEVERVSRGAGKS